jgi:hypothetical protein
MRKLILSIGPIVLAAAAVFIWSQTALVSVQADEITPAPNDNNETQSSRAASDLTAALHASADGKSIQ